MEYTLRMAQQQRDRAGTGDVDAQDNPYKLLRKPRRYWQFTGSGLHEKRQIVSKPQSARQKAAVNDLKLGMFDQVEFVHFQNVWETSK